MKRRAALVTFLFLIGAVGAEGQKAEPAPPADPLPATTIPAVSDTMAWISAHFEKSAQTLILPVGAELGQSAEQRQLFGSRPIDTDLTIATTHTYSVSFQDCSVTLTQRAVNDATQKVADKKAVDGAMFLTVNGDAVQQEHNVEHDSTVVGPFDLSNLRPDKIVVEPQITSAIRAGPRLRITAITAIPNAVTVDGQDLLDAFGLGALHADNEQKNGGRLALAMTPSKSPDAVSELTIDFATQEMADRQAKAWKAAIAACGGKAVPDKLF